MIFRIRILFKSRQLHIYLFDESDTTKMITVKSKMQRPVTFQQTFVFGFSQHNNIEHKLSNKTLIVPLAMIVLTFISELCH